MTMRRLIGAILLVTFLNGCAQLPLVSTIEGSLSINGAIAGVTGKYEHQAASAFVNMASHKSTGKTVSQHLYTAVETKWTKNRLEKHFPNKELTITNFEIANKSLNDVGIYLKNHPMYPSTKNLPASASASASKLLDNKIKWNGFNYRVYDSAQPNFFTN